MKIEEYKPLSVYLHIQICKAMVEKELSNWQVNEKGELSYG